MNFYKVFFCLVLLNINNVNATLRAVSAKTIQGNHPYLVAEGNSIPADQNDILNFTIPTTDGGVATYYGNTPLPMATLTSGFSPNLKISDFNIMGADNFRDDDGDEQMAPNGYVYSANWVDRFGVTPDSNELLDTCRAPYQLTISADNLNVVTQYGDPSNIVYSNLTKTFSIDVQYDNPICYIKPFDLYSSAKDPIYGGGHSADFNPLWGFKAQSIASSGKSWPTTAFSNAKFQIITRELDKTNDNYTFSVETDTNNALTYDSSTNYFTFTSNRPKGPITIKATNTKGENFEYSFTITTLAGPATNTFNINSVINNCVKAQYSGIFSVSQFTNSPIISDGSTRFSRQIDGTLQGEWGRLTQYGWANIYYWTNTLDPNNSSNHLMVYADNGSIRSYKNSTVGGQACFLKINQ